MQLTLASMQSWPRRLAARLDAAPLDMAILAGLGIIGFGSGWWARHVLLDDALITFRVAENLARGNGFVYNLGERVQVTTTPLYTMLVALGVWLFGSALPAALVLNLVLAALIPMLAYDLGRRLAGRMTGLGGALLLTIAPLLVMAFSMESYLYVALILASVDAYLAGYRWLAGVLAGLTALVRGDGVLLAACLLPYDLVARRRLDWRLIGPAVAIPAAWYGLATLYFGSPFPSTLNAKVAQGEFNWLGERFLDGLAAHWDKWTRGQDYDSFYLFPLFIALGCLAAKRERPWLILIGRDLLYILVFVGLAVPAADWYYAPLMPGLALLCARGVHLTATSLTRLGSGLLRQPERENNPVVTMITAGLLAFLLTILYPAASALIARHPDWKAQVYPDTGRWIAANTNTTATLATIDIGHLGYWSGRQIIDIAGLAQPDVAAHLAEGDFGYAIQHYEPDLLLIGSPWLPEVQRTPWFQSHYAPRRYFHFDTLAEPLLLFSRFKGVKVQPELMPASTSHPFQASFNGQISLTGYQLNQPLHPSSNLILTCFWQADAPVATDLTVFIHLVDGANTIVVQGDSQPQNGFYATSYWQPGEKIIDTHLVPLPASLPAGRYDILLGWYDGANGQRLPSLDENGATQGDTIRLSGVEVVLP